MQVKSKTRDLLIGGEWARANEYISVRSPYNGAEVGRAGKAHVEQVNLALEKAQHAFLTQPLPPYRRAEILDNAATLINERSEELARTIALEAGKPIKAARVEVSRAVSTFTFAAVEARTLTGEMIPMEASSPGMGKIAFTLKEPVGVVGAITPFNFPVNLVAHKLAPAVAAGCPVILKPASSTPLSAFNLAEILLEAGLPGGYLSVVPGPGSEIGDVLVQDDRVRYITFTGSAQVGWAIQGRAKKKVGLELGNSTPLIVHSDADLDNVSSVIASGAYSYAGQSCISIQRVIVQEGVHDALVELLVPKIEQLITGDPLDESTDVGPLITPEDRDRVLQWVQEAENSGAEVLTGGVLDEGILRPTLLDNVDPRMKVSCQEIFGPVASITSYRSLKEAIELANGTKYGLQAGIFTKDLYNTLTAAKSLKFAGILVNEAPTFRADQMPYGGMKESGNTREGPHYAIREMTEDKLIVLSG